MSIKKRKKRELFLILLIGFLFLSLSTFVIAIPPVQTTIQDSTNGLIIEYIKDDNIKVNETFEYHFHVYNISNGVLLNSDTISCTGHMYDAKGMNQISMFAESFGEEDSFYFNVSAGNFTNLGLFSYQVHCNDSVKGGFVSDSISVTPTGEEATETEAIVGVGLILGMILLAFLFAFFGFKFAESEIMFPIAIFFMVLSLIMGVYITQLGYLYTRDLLSALSIDALQFNVFLGITWGLIGIAFISMIFFMLKALKEIKVKKSKKEHGEGWNEKKQQYE